MTQRVEGQEKSQADSLFVRFDKQAFTNTGLCQRIYILMKSLCTEGERERETEREGEREREREREKEREREREENPNIQRPG